MLSPKEINKELQKNNWVALDGMIAYAQQEKPRVKGKGYFALFSKDSTIALMPLDVKLFSGKSLIEETQFYNKENTKQIVRKGKKLLFILSDGSEILYDTRSKGKELEKILESAGL